MHPIRLFTLVGASVGAALAAGAMFQPETATDTAIDTAALAESSPAAAIAGARQSDLPGLARLLPSPAGPAETGTRVASGPDCETGALLGATAHAMLALRVFAPCQAGEPITIAHGPLRVTERIGQDGQLALILPALAPEAEVTLAFADGQERIETAQVADFADHARLVVRWTGPAMLDLHAYVDDANWGDTGHVHAALDKPGPLGFITVIGGDGPDQARVYTYPAGHNPYARRITVEAELAVTPASCGGSLDAEILLIRAEAPVGRHSMDIAVPDCATPAGFVLLQNILPADALDMAALN